MYIRCTHTRAIYVSVPFRYGPITSCKYIIRTTRVNKSTAPSDASRVFGRQSLRAPNAWYTRPICGRTLYPPPPARRAERVAVILVPVAGCRTQKNRTVSVAAHNITITTYDIKHDVPTYNRCARVVDIILLLLLLLCYRRRTMFN